jgi:hypothetical protein
VIGAPIPNQSAALSDQREEVIPRAVATRLHLSASVDAYVTLLASTVNDPAARLDALREDLHAPARPPARLFTSSPGAHAPGVLAVSGHGSGSGPWR